MEYMVIKCPRGCPDTFWTKTEMLNHHLACHERPVRSVPVLTEEEMEHGDEKEPSMEHRDTSRRAPMAGSAANPDGTVTSIQRSPDCCGCASFPYTLCPACYRYNYKQETSATSFAALTKKTARW